MTFTTMNLTGERVLVRGTDLTGKDGETVLDSSQWNEVNRHRNVAEAGKDFDAEVDNFFAPLLRAAEKFETAREGRDEDPIAKFVLHEGTPSVQGREEIAVHLNKDSIVLRLIERGDTDRLVWVGDSLEVLEVLPGTSTASVVPQQRGVEPHDFEVEDGGEPTEG